MYMCFSLIDIPTRDCSRRADEKEEQSGRLLHGAANQKRDMIVPVEVVQEAAQRAGRQIAHTHERCRDPHSLCTAQNNKLIQI